MARREYTLEWGRPLDAPLPLRPLGTLGRWLWPLVIVGGYLALVGYTLAHDDPRPGLSDRGWLILGLAAVLAVLLTVYRNAGPRLLARVAVEYAVVALLAVLLVTAGQPTEPARSGTRPPMVEAPTRPPARADVDPPTLLDRAADVGGWLAGLWRRADEQADRPAPPSSTTRPTRPGR
jgi:hypothetical protein